jgi:hypothetical protein
LEIQRLSRTVPVPIGETSIDLPVNYRGNVGYNADRWSAIAEAGKGFGGNSLHAGYEYRFTRLEVSWWGWLHA